MMEIYPWDLGPSSPIWMYQENDEALELLLPWTADFIDSVYVGSLVGDGTIIPIGWLPIDDIIEAIGDTASIATDLDIFVGLVVQYRDSNTVYVMPGQVSHRGNFKRQGFDPNTSKALVIDVSASLRDPVADATSPGTSGLDADTKYYGYAVTDVATSAPTYRWSKQPPTYDGGYGPEHPSDDTYRFIGSLRTGPAPDAAILPYHRYEDGRVILRDVVVGPSEPTTNLLTGDTSGYVEIDLSDVVPETADVVFLSAEMDSYSSGSGAELRVRAKGDVETDSGFSFHPKNGSGDDRIVSTGWMEVAVCTLDPATDEPRAPVIEVKVGGSSIGVSNVADTTVVIVGFHERLS